MSVDRVSCGGSWHGSPLRARVALRLRYAPDSRSSRLGFRIARKPEQRMAP